MNERIQELAEQATSIVEMIGPQGYASSYANFDREKFAELIVQECLAVINAEIAVIPIAGEYEIVWKMGMECGAGLIKKHFGVES